jgi:hypothetical protein
MAGRRETFDLQRMILSLAQGCTRCRMEPGLRIALKTTALQCLLMPKSFFRVVAVLLLALTIPVQGLAAVTGAQCMALTHHEDAGWQENHAHAHDEADAHDVAVHDEGNNNHCGPCTACCASASIAGPVGHSILSSPSNTKYVFSQSLPPGVQPDGLDRPPLAL